MIAIDAALRQLRDLFEYLGLRGLRLKNLQQMRVKRKRNSRHGRVQYLVKGKAPHLLPLRTGGRLAAGAEDDLPVVPLVRVVDISHRVFICRGAVRGQARPDPAEYSGNGCGWPAEAQQDDGRTLCFP